MVFVLRIQLSREEIRRKRDVGTVGTEKKGKEEEKSTR